MQKRKRNINLNNCLLKLFRFDRILKIWYATNMKKIMFANNLKRLRLEKNLSQKALADKLNVNFRTVSAWEKSVCEPSIEMLVKISELFDETLEDLIF